MRALLLATPALLGLGLGLPAAAQDEAPPSHALVPFQETRLLPSAQACRAAAQAVMARLPPPAQAGIPARAPFVLEYVPLIPGMISLSCVAEGRQWRLTADVRVL